MIFKQYHKNKYIDAGNIYIWVGASTPTFFVPIQYTANFIYIIYCLYNYVNNVF